MPFQKGNKLGGRRKGIPNKATAEARHVALAFLDRRTAEEIDGLWEQAKVEDAGKALAMYFGAVEFALPKLARTEVTGKDGEALVIEVRKYEGDNG